MAREFSKEICSAIEAFLEKKEFHFAPADENGVIRMGLNLSSKFKHADVIFFVRKDSFIMYTIPNLSADEESMAAVAEFITRANYGLNFGNFELNFDDGEIRYKTDLMCDDAIPTYDQIDDIFYANVYTLDRYGNGLASVAYGFAKPKDAIEDVENKK